MKSSLGLLVFLLVGFIANAQILTPEMVVNRMPSITITVCKTEVREQFLNQVYKLEAEVKEEISTRRSKAKTNSKGMDEQAAKKQMNQMGYSVSDADMQKMKNASKEEKQAMAMAMMQGNMNMSVEEAKKAGKMSKEGQKAWGEAMSTEMMADAQANPDRNKAAQKNNMAMFEMAQEQSQLAQKIQLSSQKFVEQLEEFNKLKEKTKIEYEVCVKKAKKFYEEQEGENDEATMKAFEACFQNYCGYLTPKYSLVLLDGFHAIVALGDDYNRMDFLANELASATTGSEKEIFEPGLTYLEALMDYINHLKDLPAPDRVRKQF